MGRMSLVVPGAAIALSVLATDARGLTIELDFSQDTSGFFSNADAKAAMEAAAQDLSDAILTPLGATVDTNTASFGVGSASFNFEYNYTHPSNGTDQVFDPAVLPANTVKVFVGAQTLGGTILGQGGPGGAGVRPGFGASAAQLQQQINDVTEAWNQAHTAATANIRRGGGPVMTNLSGTVSDTGGNISLDYDLDFGPALGNVWFDDDTNWHFDHTTAVADNHFDFYSVALHELLHAVGIGLGQSWNDLVSPGDSKDWLGSEVLALLGDGDDILEADSAHIAEGTQSLNINGVLQEVVMDPTLTDGTRKYLTELDLAFLTDIGWTVAAIPEPSTFLALAGASCLLLGRRRAA